MAFFDKLKQGLDKTKSSIDKKINNVFSVFRKVDEELLEELEEVLVMSDIGVETSVKIIDELRNKIKKEKIENEEDVKKALKEIMSDILNVAEPKLNLQTTPSVILVIGVNGVGKTTSIGKIANNLVKQGKKVVVGAADTFREAAVEQLEIWAKRSGSTLVKKDEGSDPASVVYDAIKKTKELGADVLIIDTAGRLSIDEALMKELNDINDAVSPTEILLLVDAMSGQDAINVANAFHQALSLTGIVMSKLDGDARGGSALSIKHLTGIPIKFAGVGEKFTDLDVFHPDRMADRILGMGDVVTLAEKVQEEIDEKEAAKEAAKMMDGKFTLDDLVKNMKRIQRMGSLGGLLKLIPGMPSITDEQKEKGEKEMVVIEAIINSMTPYERAHPEVLKNSRKVRIAKGCGKTNADINRLLKKYEQMQEMMKRMQQYKKTGRMPPGGMGLPPGMGGGMF